MSASMSMSDLHHFCSTGNLDKVIQYHEAGFVFDSMCMDLAASKGHLGVVQWLHEYRTEGCTTYAMDWSIVHRRFKMIQWLHENRTEGCTYIAINYAQAYGYDHIVDYLTQVGY